MMAYNIKSIKQEFKDKGIFYTPEDLALLMKSYTKKPKSVYDPTCGDGMLLSMYDDDVEKYGQEINQEQLEIAKKRLVNFTGVCGDTLKQPAFIGKKFDCIVANYPFSISWDDNVGDDERFASAPCVPPKSKADYAFLLHIIHYLSNNGKAVTLNFPGILYRGGREGVLRKWFVDNNYIEKIVLIPGNTFVDTKIQTVLMILSKNKTTTDIEFEDLHIKKSRFVSVDEISENGYILSPNIYVYNEPPVIKIDPLVQNNTARQRMITLLKADLLMELEISKLEGWDINEYIDALSETINRFRQ